MHIVFMNLEHLIEMENIIIQIVYLSSCLDDISSLAVSLWMCMCVCVCVWVCACAW